MPPGNAYALEAVKADGTKLAQDSFKEFCGDREFLLAAAEANCGVAMSVAEFASNALKEDRTFWLQLMGKPCSGFCLKFAPKTFVEDRDFMGQAFRIMGQAFLPSCWREDCVAEACEQICMDRDFVFQLAKDGIYVLYLMKAGHPQHVHFNDREMMMLCVKNDPEHLQMVSEELKDDREIVEAALQERFGYLVQHASKRLQADRDIGLLATRMTGNPLLEKDEVDDHSKEMPDGCVVVPYLSEELQNDREIVLEAVRKKGQSLWFSPAQFRDDREMMLEAIRTYPRILEIAGDALKNDRGFALDAIRMNGKSLQYLEVDKYENSQELVQEAKRGGYPSSS